MGLSCLSLHCRHDLPQDSNALQRSADILVVLAPKGLEKLWEMCFEFLCSMISTLTTLFISGQ